MSSEDKKNVQRCSMQAKYDTKNRITTVTPVTERWKTTDIGCC